MQTASQTDYMYCMPSVYSMPSVRSILLLETHVQDVIAGSACRCSDSKHQPFTVVQSRTAATTASWSTCSGILEESRNTSKQGMQCRSPLEFGRSTLKHTQN